MPDSATSPNHISSTSTAAGPAQQPPQSRLTDIFRLLAALLAALVRGRRDSGAVFGAWLHQLTQRHRSNAIVVKLGGKRLLIVASEQVSRDILETPPAEHAFVAGSPKVSAMSYLAPRALTIAHGADWSSLRQYNEHALSAGARDHQQEFLNVVRYAFAQPVHTHTEMRRRMASVMLRIVVGEDAPERLAADVQQLFALVQSPLRRKLAGRRGRELRARLYDDLRSAWRAPAARTLLGAAHPYADLLEEDEALQQVPHWMFTFTGSGTDLLARGLALLCARPAAHARVLQELTAVLPLDDASDIAQLTYLEACLREAGRLFPPVTRTFHRAPQGATAGGYRVDPGVEVLHYLPLLYRHSSARSDAHHFRPERWLDAATRPYPDIFLSGARACPGQHLILFVCKAAVATLLEQGLATQHNVLSTDPLPLTFPRKEVRFAYDHRS